MEIQEEIVEVGVKNISPNDLPVYAKTGDSANLMLILLALLTSMLIGAVVLIRGRRREN